MAIYRNMLMLTNADISLMAGDAILVIRRAEELYAQKKIKTICYIYNSIKKIPEYKSEAISFRLLKNKNTLSKIIDKLKPDYCVLCGFKICQLFWIVEHAKKNQDKKFKIIFDLQGCLEELIEFHNSIPNTIKYYAGKIIFRYIINKVDGCFVVSDELEAYAKKYLKDGKSVSFYKVRCGITDVFKPDEMILKREKIRKQLNIESDTTVFVYSGFRMAWQNVDKIIEQFKVYDKYLEKTHFCFFCNVDDSFINTLKNAFPKGNFTAMFLNKEQYFDFLTACDIGFLIRDRKMTNYVAFPNKFSDYLSVGLIIAMNDALRDPIRVLKKYDMSFLNTDICPYKGITELINIRKENYLNYYNKCLDICTQELKYSSQIKKLEL